MSVATMGTTGASPVDATLAAIQIALARYRSMSARVVAIATTATTTKLKASGRIAREEAMSKTPKADQVRALRERRAAAQTRPTKKKRKKR